MFVVCTIAICMETYGVLIISIRIYMKKIDILELRLPYTLLVPTFPERNAQCVHVVSMMIVEHNYSP